MAELEMIVMGTEHGRDREQPTWNIVDVPNWRLHPPGSWMPGGHYGPGPETFLGMVVRTYVEATTHGSADMTYLVGLVSDA